jgi:hypothetical protein
VKTLTADLKGADAKIEDLNAALELTNTWLSVSGDCDPDDAAGFLETIARKISELRRKAHKEDQDPKP